MECSEHRHAPPAEAYSSCLAAIEEIHRILIRLESDLNILRLAPANRAEVQQPQSSSPIEVTHDPRNHVRPPAALAPLTAREEQVVELLLQGRTNRRIASTLRISENTVKNHCHSIFVKFKVGDRTELVARLLGGPRIPTQGR
ncbi:response regulator transcription factor [Streptomyces sp. NPDC006879]|uniref:response regulator transcription factor n=1 Tax=Streptomyces sp. NPDC006879 TaxID=3364767 RepID=UPI0036BDD70F